MFTNIPHRWKISPYTGYYKIHILWMLHSPLPNFILNKYFIEKHRIIEIRLDVVLVIRYQINMILN